MKDEIKKLQDFISKSQKDLQKFGCKDVIVTN